MDEKNKAYEEVQENKEDVVGIRRKRRESKK